MPYLAQSAIFETEKAFDTDFPVEDVPGARRSNHQTNAIAVDVHEIEDHDSWDINKHGFCIIHASTQLDAADAFTRKREVQGQYWAQIEALLYDRFPEYTRIESYDCTVRRRDAEFPKKVTLYNDDYEQPAQRPHCDCSQEGAFKELGHVFPGQLQHLKDKDFDILNVWRPLVSPNYDWPLALCDWTSIDATNDIRLNDAIRRDRVDENSLLHFNPGHRWYYISGQTDEQLLVFRNADSLGQRPRGFHCSVENTVESGPPRESVEVRLVAIR